MPGEPANSRCACEILFLPVRRHVGILNLDSNFCSVSAGPWKERPVRSSGACIIVFVCGAAHLKAESLPCRLAGENARDRVARKAYLGF